MKQVYDVFNSDDAASGKDSEAANSSSGEIRVVCPNCGAENLCNDSARLICCVCENPIKVDQDAAKRDRGSTREHEEIAGKVQSTPKRTIAAVIFAAVCVVAIVVWLFAGGTTIGKAEAGDKQLASGNYQEAAELYSQAGESQSEQKLLEACAKLIEQGDYDATRIFAGYLSESKEKAIVYVCNALEMQSLSALKDAHNQISKLVDEYIEGEIQGVVDAKIESLEEKEREERQKQVDSYINQSNFEMANTYWNIKEYEKALNLYKSLPADYSSGSISASQRISAIEANALSISYAGHYSTDEGYFYSVFANESETVTYVNEERYTGGSVHVTLDESGNATMTLDVYYHFVRDCDMSAGTTEDTCYEAYCEIDVPSSFSLPISGEYQETDGVNGTIELSLNPDGTLSFSGYLTGGSSLYDATYEVTGTLRKE